MTSHELARLLLAMDDGPIVVAGELLTSAPIVVAGEFVSRPEGSPVFIPRDDVPSFLPIKEENQSLAIVL